MAVPRLDPDYPLKTYPKRHVAKFRPASANGRKTQRARMGNLSRAKSGKAIIPTFPFEVGLNRRMIGPRPVLIMARDEYGVNIFPVVLIHPASRCL